MSARGSLTNRSGTITLGGTAQALAAANSDRSYLFIQNLSQGPLYVDFDGTTAVQTQPSTLIPAGASLTASAEDFCPTGAISIIGPTTGQAFVAKER